MMTWLLVLLPLLAAAVITFVPRLATVTAGMILALTAALGLWAAATEADSVISWGPRLELTVAATDFAGVMAVLVPLIALPIVVYAAATEVGAPVRLLALLTAFAGAMELLVLADDLLTLLIGWELVGAFSWVLIAHDWGHEENVKRASHAFITTRAGDVGIYLAAGVAFASTGSFAYSDLGAANTTALQVIAGGVLVAAAAKSAQVPFSPWLFSAMAGPTPVSALLHSSTMVAAGAYLLVRLTPHLDAVQWFLPSAVIIGLTSTLTGGVVASVHRHPKRLLAASTTAQYGLMFVAIGVGSITAAAAQLVTHAAFKSLLFLTAGTAMHAADSDDLADMQLGRRLPVIGAAAAIGALALAALPPLGGAWSKEQIAGAAFERSPFIGVLVLAAALLGAFYALRYWVLSFGPGSGGPERTPPEVTASIGFLALVSLVLGVLWIPAINEAGAQLIEGEIVPTAAFELGLGLAALFMAAALVATLQRRALLVHGAVPVVVANAALDWFGIADTSRRVIVGPVLAASRILAAFDDRVIDAGIRASGRVAGSFSRLLRRRSELSIDALVNGVGGSIVLIATGSRAADDHGVDRTAEGVARVFGRSGDLLRRLQTGLSHHYYVIVAIGLVALVAALAAGTS